MPELGPSGSARGAVSNHRPYRDPDTHQPHGPEEPRPARSQNGGERRCAETRVRPATKSAR
jgi:hypothetical protein